MLGLSIVNQEISMIIHFANTYTLSLIVMGQENLHPLFFCAQTWPFMRSILILAPNARNTIRFFIFGAFSLNTSRVGTLLVRLPGINVV